jgi:hypothetical protein
MIESRNYAKPEPWRTPTQKRRIAQQRADEFKRAIDEELRQSLAGVALTRSERGEIRERVKGGLHPLRGIGL